MNGLGLRYAVTSWLRWHLPCSRERALDFVENHSEAYYHVLEHKIEILDRRVEFLVKALGDTAKDEMYAAWDRTGCQPPAVIKGGGMRSAARRPRLQVVKSGPVTKSAG